MSLLGIFTPGPVEIIIISAIGVLLFGPQLPKVARSIGAAIPEFKKGLKGVEDEVKDIKDSMKN